MPLPPVRSDKWTRRSRRESGSTDRPGRRNQSVAISAGSHPSRGIIVPEAARSKTQLIPKASRGIGGRYLGLRNGIIGCARNDPVLGAPAFSTLQTPFVFQYLMR